MTLAACALLTLAACENKITEDNYAKITPGMDIAQVEGILGPGELQNQGGMGISGGGVASGAVANSQDTYIWKGKSMTITVVTAKGKVVQVYKQ
jgi:hypothetical protein